MKIEKEHLANLGKRVAQKVLAYEVTKIIHGEEAANEAIKMSEVLFSNDIKSLSEKAIEEIFGSYKIDLNEGMMLEDALIAIKAASSKREAREFIKNGAVLLNGEKALDSTLLVNKESSLYNKYIVIRRGKKNYYLINLM